MTAVFLLLVLVCVFGGFALEGGPLFNIIAVWQEYIIIFGAGSMIFMAMMPQKIFKHIATFKLYMYSHCRVRIESEWS